MNSTPIVVNSLRGGATLASLQGEFGIYAKRSSRYTNLVQFNYDQIESKAGNPVSDECRGLILDESNNWAVVARPFDRFHNAGMECAAPIDWNTAVAEDKLDGSMMIMYFYADKWHIATRGNPHAEGNVQNSPETGTYEDLFWSLFPVEHLNNYDPGFTYMFELVGPSNRHVCRYDSNALILLGIRNKSTGEEISPYTVLDAEKYGVYTAANKPINDLVDLIAYCETINPLDGEGFVVRDANFNRIKVKSSKYVALHHMRSSFSTKSFLEIFLKGEVDEVTTAFPEFKSKFADIESRFTSLEHTVEFTWEETKGLPTQKEFALAVKDKLYSAVLFNLRKGVVNSVFEELKNMRIEYLMELLGYKN